MLTEPRDRVVGGSASGRGFGPTVGVVPDAGERLRQAIVEHAVADGLLGVVVGTLCADAGVSRRTFYDRYSSVLDLFRDAYGTLDGALRRAIGDATRGTADRAEAAIAAIVRFACVDRVRAHAVFVQAPTAGAEVAARRGATLRWCAALVDDPDGGDPDAVGLPVEIAWHGVWSVIAERVAADDFVGLRRLQPQLVAAVRGPRLAG